MRIKRFKKILIVAISSVALFFNTKVYAQNITKEQLESILPSEITIPINSSYFSNDENYLLYRDATSQNITYIIRNLFINKFEEIGLQNLGSYTVNEYDKNADMCIYISTSETSDDVLIDANTYIQHFISKKDYFQFYYRISLKDKTYISIPVKIYLSNIENVYTNELKQLYDSISDEYILTIKDAYNIHIEKSKLDDFNAENKLYLNHVGIFESENIKFDTRYVYSYNYENSTLNLNDDFLLDISMLANNQYVAQKYVKYTVNNIINIPSNISNDEESIINYITEYFKNEYFKNEKIEVKYINNKDYVLYIDDHIKCLLSVSKNLDAMYSGGHGTKNDPYLISKPQDLYNIRYNLNAYYKLINDIDLLYDTTNIDGKFYNDGSGWLPISYDTDNNIYNYEIKFEGDEFNGTLDGNNHSITGLYINRYNTDYIGLFGYIGRNGVVKNVIIKSVDIQGSHAIGIIAGENHGIIRNVRTTGLVHYEKSDNNRHTYIGGIVGINYGQIINTYNFATVSAIIEKKLYETRGAGIASYNGIEGGWSGSIGYIKNCINFGNVTVINKYKTDGQAYAGFLASAAGIVELNSAYAKDVANFGNIYGNLVSGLIEYNNAYVLYNGYNAGNLKLYKDFYIGKDKLYRYSTVGSSDYPIYGLYGIKYTDDDVISYKESRIEYEDNPIEMELYLNKSSNQFDTFDFNNDWQYFDNFTFPLIKGMNIQFPIYNKSINDDEIIIDLDNQQYKLNYVFNNFEYDRLLFESSSDKVNINDDGIIKLNDNEQSEKIETTITIRTLLSNQSISKKIIIKNNKITLREKVISSGYKIENKFVYGFNLNETVNSIKSKLGNDVEIITSTKIISTGTKFKYKDELYTAVMFGDISGDGLINSADLLKIRQHLLGTSVLSDAYFTAADINHDNNINSADLLRVRQHLLGTKPIE